MKSEVLERERKYELKNDADVPRLDRVPGVAGVSDSEQDRLVAVYFDTPDLRLARFGATLRRREGGPDAGWQLKVPAGTDARTEVRARPSDEEDPPLELTDLVAGVVRGAPLVRVAQISTSRRRWRLLGRDGELLAEVTDDRVTGQRAGRRSATTWREVEVELARDADAGMLDEVESRLGLRRSAAGSKLHRVLKMDTVDTSGAARPGRRATAGEAVLSYLRDQVDAIARQDVRVRRGADDAVHQLRVAARRLRSALRVFGRVVDRERTRRIEAELRWLGGELSGSRDAEVLEQRFRGAVAGLPEELVLGEVNTRLTRRFTPVRAAADKAALHTLDEARYLRLRDRLDELLAEPPLTERARRRARKELPRHVRRAYRKVDRRMRTVAGLPPGDRRETAMHGVRKAAKRLRYAAEATEPFAGKPAARVRKRAKGFTKALGEYQDSVVAGPVLRQLGVAAHLAGDNAFTFGLLAGQERARTERDITAGWRALAVKSWLKD